MVPRAGVADGLFAGSLLVLSPQSSPPFQSDVRGLTARRLANLSASSGCKPAMAGVPRFGSKTMHKMARSSAPARAMSASPEMDNVASFAMEEGHQGGRPSHSSASSSDSAIPRMLARVGDIRLQADRDQLHRMSEQIKDYVDSAKGYTQSSRANAGYKEHGSSRMAGASIDMEIQVPAAVFRQTMDFLRSLTGEQGALDVLSESESVQDVTERFVDQKARAESLDGTHKALLKLLDRANVVNDILKVQRELRQVVQQLEARKATVQSLKNRAEFSRISVHLVQRPLPPIIDLGGGNDWAVWKPGRTACLSCDGSTGQPSLQAMRGSFLA